jgi:hypothetical protein
VSGEVQERERTYDGFDAAAIEIDSKCLLEAEEFGKGDEVVIEVE